ncbi:MAG TPA: CxxC-x17-CxxC domain-containing protein [Candidatus Paceibacterota bacterium]|nr:CxxC-x17-CxxC domain-containing protein [Candidatus Paceibacterota bacterium]
MDKVQLPYNKDLTYIGLTSFRDKNQLFGIKRKDRRQHVYILGKSGTGKSALMFNMIIQNIQNGDGVCLVDPHGENVETVLSAIPRHRLKDVVYFNPADTEYHIGFNVLELVDEKYKHLVASGLMGIFTKIWANAWSARMEYILNNAILALLDTPGTTMLGIPRMLVDKDYRQKIITNLKDPVIKAFWVHEYEEWQDKFRNEAIAPIQNKVGQFLSTSIIRNILGQAKSTINIFDMMNEGKIFLVNVSKGRIGEDNSALLGGMIITKIQLAAMERVRIPEDERKDFYLYVDEFQNFVTDAFAGILSEARKYRLNLTVAHQYTAQLVTKESSSVRDAIFGNVGTMIIFRVGADDADFLEKEFEPEFTPEDIVNLPNYKIYIKLMIDGVTSRPFSSRTLPPMVESGNQEIEDEVIKVSRELYCRPRAEVEKEINDWSGMSIGDDATATNSEKFDAVCSSCGTATKVPFKPEPGRPIYCRECITKIKAGEMKPIKGAASEIRYDESRFFKPLADLGIEFQQEEDPQAKKGFAGLRKVFSKKGPEKDKFSAPKSFPKSPANIPPFPVKQARDTNTPRDTSALRDILNKTLNEKVEPISLKDLIPKEEEKKPKEDRSASREEMNKLKSFIAEVEVQGVPLPDPVPDPVPEPMWDPTPISRPEMVPDIKPDHDPVPEPRPIEEQVPTMPDLEKAPPLKFQTEPVEEKEPAEASANANTNVNANGNANEGNKAKQNVKEVPEDILKKMLE